MSVYDELKEEFTPYLAQVRIEEVRTKAIIEIVGHLEAIAAQLHVISAKLDTLMQGVKND